MSTARRGWRYPLALRLLTALLLNFLLVAALFAALPGRGGLGWDLLLTTAARERLLGLGEQLASTLAAAPRSQWQSLLQQAESPHGVRFFIRQNFRVGGPPPPPGSGHPPPGQGPLHPPPDERFASDDAPPPRPAEFKNQREIMADMIAIERLGWRDGFALRIPTQVNGQALDINMQVSGWLPLLQILGIADWVLFALLCLIATGLLWAPLVWRLTRTITALTRATHTIAEGRFDVRVPLTRRDELGQLAESVNNMAARLERQVETQKQFVADVAHEVTAPLARLRVGLELLGEAADERTAAVQADLQDDAEQMSTLLDELLLFSRAGQSTGREPMQPCQLLALVQATAAREATASQMLAAMQLKVPAKLMVNVPPALVQRALANLIRNALRYGQVEVAVFAEAIGSQAQISIRDRGPGVPAEALARLGEPFYRPDFARAREHGGTGLGLAIVRRCVAAAHGSVVFRNRPEGGFEAVLTLPLADQ